MAKILTDLQKLSLDAYKKVGTKFNDVTCDEALQNAFTAILGEAKDFDMVKLMRNSDKKDKFFALIEEAIDIPVNDATITEAFQGIIATDALGLDDVKIIKVPNKDLFKVSVSANDNNDIRRQKVVSGTVTMTKMNLSLKLYADFLSYRAGKIDWTELVNRARVSMVKEVSNQIYSGLKGAYANIPTKYKIGGTPTFDAIVDIIADLERATGLSYAIYGGKKQLTKLSALDATNVVSVIGAGGLADSKKEEFAGMRRFGSFASTTPMVQLPDVPGNAVGGGSLADEVYILPVGMDIINFATFGQPLVVENAEAGARTTREIEFLLEQTIGVSVLVASIFGIVRF